NDANFTYHTGELRLAYRDVEVRPDGAVVPIGEEKVFELTKAHQIANFADYCNHCGNCDTFCPEYDGRYLKKPNFYGSKQAFEAGSPYDGFVLAGFPGSTTLIGRIAGRVHWLEQPGNGDGYFYHDGVISVRVSNEGQIASDPAALPSTTHQ